MMMILWHLIKLFLKKEGIDMMIKLYAINLYYGKITWTEYLEFNFSELINTKVKEQLALMCDEETLDAILAS